MANLIDVAEELEFIPEDQLAAMIDDPNSRYPSFMVLSEVQRRTKMRKMYENEMSKMNQPQTTVAEEAVMGLMQGQGAMPMQAGMSSPVNSQGSGLQGMAPPVQMQAGGLTATSPQVLLQSITQELRDPFLSPIRRQMLNKQLADIQKSMALGATGIRQTTDALSDIGDLDKVREEFPLYDYFAGGAETREKLGIGSMQREPEAQAKLVTDAALARGQANIGNQSTNNVEVDTRSTLEKTIDLVKKQDTTSAPIETSGLQSFNLEQGMQDIEDVFSTKPKAPLEERVSGITERFGLKSIDIPKITEEDRQRELSVFTLGNLAKAIGSAKNLGEIASGLGESAIGLQGLKRRQRREDIADRLAQTKADRELLSTALNIAGKEDVQDTALQAQKQAKFNAESALRREALEIDKYNNMVKRQASADELAKEQGRLLRISTAATIAKVDLLEDQLNESQKKNLIDTLQQLNKSYEQAIDVTEKQNIFNRIISISDELNKRLGIDNIPAATGAVANQITN